jgi:hypothetical protein
LGIIFKGTKQKAEAVRDQCRDFLETGGLVGSEVSLQYQATTHEMVQAAGATQG